MFECIGTGKIVFDPPRPQMKRGRDWWCVINVDREITRYFRWWVDKEVLNPLGFEKQGLCLPSFDAHISVIRGWNDVRHNFDHIKKVWNTLKKKNHNKIVGFKYSLNVRYSGDTTQDRPNHFWFVEVECPIIKEIRDELGLITTFKPHITVGRTYDD